MQVRPHSQKRQIDLYPEKFSSDQYTWKQAGQLLTIAFGIIAALTLFDTSGDEHRVMYGIIESLYCAPETNKMMYINYDGI